MALLSLAFLSVGHGAESADTSPLPASLGTYYEATAPDTLDLAERAKLGINHFTSIISPEQDYEMYWGGDLLCNGKPNLNFWWSSLMACQPKCMEALAMERIMSGSRQGLDVEAAMVNMLASHIGPDGVYWVPRYENKPWLGPKDNMPYANVHGQGRMMRAMAIWYQYTGDRKWKDLVDRMVNGMDKVMVVHKEDYAYFPVLGWLPDEYLRSCYIKDRGWKDTTEPANEKSGEEGSLFNHQGHIAGVLANWYILTGNAQALRLSGELVRFLTKPKFWADFPGGEYPGIVGSEHAHWQGHFHGYVNTLRAILEYAIAANDTRLKEFVRDGYEWARQGFIARIGYVGDGQGCGCARLIGLAVKLCYAGVGDYWEDVDSYIRNQGTEYQFTQEDAPGVMDSRIGAFAGDPFKSGWGECCSSHGNMGLFYAWDGILKYSDGVAHINLLLNRASPWMDVDSYLPYEGKVVLKNKKAREALVRIPLWVDLKTVKCRVGHKAMPPKWFGRYLRIGKLNHADIVTIEFPVETTVEKLTASGTLRNEWAKYPGNVTYTCTFRGNTLIEISPELLPGSPFYKERPAKYRASKAEMKKVTRFVSTRDLKW